MDSTNLDERPHKKRRFFAEDSSPIAATSVSHPSPPPSVSPNPTPPDAIISEIPDQAEEEQVGDGGSENEFDAGLLQAVVGELSPSVLQKLRDVSGNDVQRGMQSQSHDFVHY